MHPMGPKPDELCAGCKQPLGDATEPIYDRRQWFCSDICMDLWRERIFGGK